MTTRGAAFFDLDRTLMSGSSGAQFGRAAFRSGMVSRRQMTRWGLDHLRFQLRGATDRDTDELVEEIRRLLAGVPERSLRRMVPDLLAGILPRIYPQMLEEVRARTRNSPRLIAFQAPLFPSVRTQTSDSSSEVVFVDFSFFGIFRFLLHCC